MGIIDENMILAFIGKTLKKMEEFSSFYMLIASKSMSEIDKLKKLLMKEFKTKDLVPINKILGMEITRDREKKKLWLTQRNFIKKII